MVVWVLVGGMVVLVGVAALSPWVTRIWLVVVLGWALVKVVKLKR